MNTCRLHAVSLLLCVLPVAGSIAGPKTGQGDPPPVARTVDAVDHDFGLTLPDPYRWMEGAKNSEFDSWLKTQSDDARARLDVLPGLGLWQEQLKKVNGNTIANTGHRRAGDRLFSLRFSNRSMTTLMVREADGRERILLDPTTLNDSTGTALIASYAPSPDGNRVAIGIEHGGTEIDRLLVMDVASGKWMPGAIETVEGSAQWLPDGNGFVYLKLAPENERTGGDPQQDQRVLLHRLGASPDEDPILLRAGRGAGSNPHFAMGSEEFPSITFIPGSDWAIATAEGARSEIRLCAARSDTAVKPSAPWRCLVDYADDIQNFAVHGDTLYMLSMKDRPNGRILAIDLSAPDATLKDAREVVAESGDAVLKGVGAARDALYVWRMSDGIDDFLHIDYADGRQRPIATALAGASYDFEWSPSKDGFLYSLQTWTMPRTVFVYQPGKDASLDLKSGQQSPADYSAIASTETEAVSADGTRVPLTIIHRRDVVLDGANRAIVDGYGGYGISLQPLFDHSSLEWVKAGGIYAIAHVRGGGEKGDAWFRAGQGANKHFGVDDLLACAQELAKRGYTTPERTALFGASMAGILVGGAVARAPDRLGAAVIDVGEFNPVRLLQGNNGADQISELGDPRTADGLKQLAAMDPYQNIHPGLKYPAVLLRIGLNDSRVPTWETGKFAAKLRASTSSGKPVWIRAVPDQGHFAVTLDAQAAEDADLYTFLDAYLPGR